MSDEILTFRAAGSTWGIPLRDVREIVSVSHVTRLPLAPDGVAGVVSLHGGSIGAVDFARLAGSASGPAGSAIVLNDCQAALLVDSVREVIHDAVLPQPAPFDWVDGVAGAANVINAARLLEALS